MKILGIMDLTLKAFVRMDSTHVKIHVCVYIYIIHTHTQMVIVIMVT